MIITPLITAEELNKIVTDMADKINLAYQGREIYAVAVLNGSFIFCADLIRKLNSKIEINFITASSYHATKSSGVVNLDISRLYLQSFNQDVLIIEDIIDTGLTLKVLLEKLKEKGARSIKVASLLKKKRDDLQVDVDFYGVEIEDQFVVGYGLDYNGLYRALPYIGVLKQD